MRPPEPCIKGRCWSPTACNGWGYCRERNEGAAPSGTIIAERRAIAENQRAKEEPQP